MDDAWPRSPSYVVASALSWLAFLAAVWAMTIFQLPQPALAVIVILLAASVALQFRGAYRLIAAQDEFIRAITVKRMLAAAQLTLALTVLLGLSQQFLGTLTIPMWVVYPLFWGAFGVVTPFIRDTRP